MQSALSAAANPALPGKKSRLPWMAKTLPPRRLRILPGVRPTVFSNRSEEHTSELQSRFDLVCRLLLEKKKKLVQSMITSDTIYTEMSNQQTMKLASASFKIVWITAPTFKDIRNILHNVNWFRAR